MIWTIRHSTAAGLRLLVRHHQQNHQQNEQEQRRRQNIADIEKQQHPADATGVAVAAAAAMNAAAGAGMASPVRACAWSAVAICTVIAIILLNHMTPNISLVQQPLQQSQFSALNHEPRNQSEPTEENQKQQLSFPQAQINQTHAEPESNNHTQNQFSQKTESNKTHKNNPPLQPRIDQTQHQQFQKFSQPSGNGNPEPQQEQQQQFQQLSQPSGNRSSSTEQKQEIQPSSSPGKKNSSINSNAESQETSQQSSATMDPQQLPQLSQPEKASSSSSSFEQSWKPAITGDECSGRRIYMYDLPPEFNTELLSRCNGGIVSWINFCNHAQNDGLGRRVPGELPFFASDLYMLEQVFHARMRTYPCRTPDPESADGFFIPYYSGLDSLPYLYTNKTSKKQHGKSLISWLNSSRWFHRRGGADHFFVTGRTTWDLHGNFPDDNPEQESLWGTSLLDLPELRNVTVLAVERRTWSVREQAVPYLTSFHPSGLPELSAWARSVASARRDRLFAFVGGSRPGLLIREIIISDCRKTSACLLLDCKALRCTHDPAAVTAGLMRARFCLQPPGDSPTRRSTFDAMIAGCVPVFFRNDSAYQQYLWHLPAQPDSYSVMIPEDDVVAGNAGIEQVLGSFSEKKVQELRNNVLALLPSIVYRGFRAGPDRKPEMLFQDAFDRSVEGFLRSVKQQNLQQRR